MSDLILMLEEGRIVRQGKPEEIFPALEGRSGTFQLTGEVLHIERREGHVILLIKIGTEQFRMIIDDKKEEELNIGDKVKVNSEMINVILEKLG